MSNGTTQVLTALVSNFTLDFETQTFVLPQKPLPKKKSHLHFLILTERALNQLRNNANMTRGVDNPLAATAFTQN